MLMIKRSAFILYTDHDFAYCSSFSVSETNKNYFI